MWVCIHDTYVHWHVCGDQRIDTNVFPHCTPLLTSVFLILDSLISMARGTRSHCPSLCARSNRGYTDEGDTAWIYEGGSAGRQEWGVQTGHLELWKWWKLCAGFWRAGRSLEVRGQHWGILSQAYACEAEWVQHREKAQSLLCRHRSSSLSSSKSGVQSLSASAISTQLTVRASLWGSSPATSPPSSRGG